MPCVAAPLTAPRLTLCAIDTPRDDASPPLSHLPSGSWRSKLPGGPLCKEFDGPIKCVGNSINLVHQEHDRAVVVDAHVAPPFIGFTQRAESAAHGTTAAHGTLRYQTLRWARSISKRIRHVEPGNMTDRVWDCRRGLPEDGWCAESILASACLSYSGHVSAGPWGYKLGSSAK